jgi:hypothetical protein
MNASIQYSIKNASVKTKILYTQGWEVNSLPSKFLQQINICSTIVTSARSKSQTSFLVSVTTLCTLSKVTYLQTTCSEELLHN